MSPTDQRSGFGFTPTEGGSGKSTALPEKNGGAGGGERQRRQRTHSLAEDVSTTELKSPEAQIPPFEKATENLEMQTESTAGKLKEKIESAAPTPPQSTKE